MRLGARSRCTLGTRRHSSRPDPCVPRLGRRDHATALLLAGPWLHPCRRHPLNRQHGSRPPLLFVAQFASSLLLFYSPGIWCMAPTLTSPRLSTFYAPLHSFDSTRRVLWVRLHLEVLGGLHDVRRLAGCSAASASPVGLDVLNGAGHAQHHLAHSGGGLGIHRSARSGPRHPWCTTARSSRQRSSSSFPYRT